MSAHQSSHQKAPQHPTVVSICQKAIATGGILTPTETLALVNYISLVAYGLHEADVTKEPSPPPASSD